MLPVPSELIRIIHADRLREAQQARLVQIARAVSTMVFELWFQSGRNYGKE